MGKAWVRVPRVSFEMALAYGWGPAHLRIPLTHARVLSAKVIGEYMHFLVDSPDIPKDKTGGVYIPIYDPQVVSERQPHSPPLPPPGEEPDV